MQLFNKIIPLSSTTITSSSLVFYAASTIGVVVVPYCLWLFIDNSYKKDGRLSTKFQRLPIWSRICKYFNATINVAEKLDSNQQYIFCQFPHGAMSFGHVLTFTNGAGFLDNVYNGDKRDLAATGLFYIPIFREMCILLGCVDASKRTAVHNLKKGRSLLIFIGGEREQLMTEANDHKIYLKDRKGFVKLALEYDIPLVPMYVYGENEIYINSNFAIGIRKWLQKNFQVGIPIVFHFLPKKVNLNLEIGSPIIYKRKSSNIAISDDEINEFHNQFCIAMEKLFENTKAKHGIDKNTTLSIR